MNFNVLLYQKMLNLSCNLIDARTAWLATSFIGHLGNAGLLSYEGLPNADTFSYTYILNHNNHCPIFIQNISTNEEAVTLTADMLQNCNFALEDRFYNKCCFIFLKCQALFSHSPEESYTPNTYVKDHCLSLSCVFKLKCCQIFFRLYWVQLVLSICGTIHWNMATHHWPHTQRKMTIPP